MGVYLYIYFMLGDTLMVNGAFLFLKGNDFKFKFIGFFLTLIGLVIVCITLHQLTIQQNV